MNVLINKIIYKFCQELKILVPFFVLIIFLINASLSKDSFTGVKEKILLDKTDARSQVQLINFFLINNQYEIAIEASTQALSYLTDNQKKKTFTDLHTQAKNLKLEEVKISNEISNWIRVSTFYPTYRDSFIKLAVLSLKANRIFEARKYTQFALALDPGSEVSKEIYNRFPAN